MRCSHEAKMHRHNCFVTLTFDDAHFPADGSIKLRDVQLFIKRLRKSLSSSSTGRPGLDAPAGRIIRFFAAGEYSPINKRPHYHLLIFNHHFPDQKLFSDQNKKQLFTSTQLQRLWPFGFSTIGMVNYQTARYCAQYSLKKISGDLAADHYTWPHPLYGYLIRVQPEFATMSKKPGLGTTWFEQYKSDCYPSDFLIVDGKKHPVPKFYDNKLKKEDEGRLEQLKRGRKAQANKQRSNNTPERLAVRQEILAEKLKRSSRNGEI